jgi:hypothetical protein
MSIERHFRGRLPFLLYALAMAEAEQLHLFHRGFWGQLSLTRGPYKLAPPVFLVLVAFPGFGGRLRQGRELVQLVPSNQRSG